jgi:hypothetical protein
MKRRLRELPAKISKRWCRETDVFEYIYLDFKLERKSGLRLRGFCIRMLARFRRVISPLEVVALRRLKLQALKMQETGTQNVSKIT